MAGPAEGSALSSALPPLQPVLLGIDPDLGGALVVLEVCSQPRLFVEASTGFRESQPTDDAL